MMKQRPWQRVINSDSSFLLGMVVFHFEAIRVQSSVTIVERWGLFASEFHAERGHIAHAIQIILGDVREVVLCITYLDYLIAH